MSLSSLFYKPFDPEDAPPGLTHRLSFVPNGVGGYRYLQERLGD